MTKLSFEALKQRAEAIASEDILMTISGGTENACHDDPIQKAKEKIKNQGPTPPPPVVCDNI